MVIDPLVLGAGAIGVAALVNGVGMAVWMRRCREAEMEARLMTISCRMEVMRSRAVRHETRVVLSEVRFFLNSIPRPSSASDFGPDDAIGLGPFPLPRTVIPPLGGDGASDGHLTGEKGDWGCL